MTEEALFHEALARTDPQERAAFLDEACAGQPELRAAVDALLAASDPSSSFLDRPAVARPPLEADAMEVPETLGTMVGPYRLIEQIGEGGFGVVFLAEQQQPIRRQVALKMIKPGMDTRQVLARFEAERQALALMDHPHIARVLDGGAALSGRPFFVMELVRGIPITKYCDQQQLTPRERLALFVPVCQAVQHAHQKGIIHRDLKPTNILITTQDDSPVPKVIDFGVAKALGQPLSEGTMATGFGRIIGTLEYMSPEHAEFQAKDIDTRADVYSLGVLLYELLTGTTPVTKEQMNQVALTELLRVIREEEPPPPSSRLTDSKDTLASISALRKLEPSRLTRTLRGELDWIVMKCLEKDRNRRYATANGLAADIQRYLHDEPIEAGPPSAAYKLRKFARKYRGVLAAVASFSLLLVAAAVVGLWLAARATQAERVAARERDRALAEKQRADDEAAIAKTVNEFIQDDLLCQADVRQQPAHLAKEKDLTVRKLLDRAALTIERRFAGQPRTEAALRLTIGKAYQALGEYKEAEKHLNRSQELRRQALPADHPDVLECMNELGELYRAQGRYAEAEQLLRTTFEARRAALGASHKDTLRTISRLAGLYEGLGRFDESEQLYQQSLEAQRQELGRDHPDTYANLAGLSLVYHRKGRNDQAESLAKQALDLCRRNFGPDNPETLLILNNLGLLYRDLGRYDEAEQVYKQALEGRLRLLGTDHPETADSLNNLAVVHWAKGRFPEAEKLLQRALESYQSIYGPEHASTLAAMNNLAALYRISGQNAEAETLYKQTLEGRQKILGENHPDTLATLNNLAVLYTKIKTPQEAIPLLEESLARHESTLGADHKHTIIARAGLGVMYRKADRLVDAIHCLEQAHHAVEKRTEPLPPELAWIANALAETYDADQQFEKAEPIYRQVLERVRKELSAEDPRVAMASSQLGWNLFRQKKYVAAEPLLLQGYQGIKRLPETVPRESKVTPEESLQRVVQLYEAWGKPEEAARWRAANGQKPPE